MNIKTMEGIVGARTNYNLMNTPMRVFRDARRRGDLATMERAMDYAGDFADKTREYEEKADEGMVEEAKEFREKTKAELEKAIKERKEDCAKEQEQIQEQKSGASNTDTVELSEEGKVLFQDTILAPEAGSGAEGKPAKTGGALVTGPLISGGAIDVQV
ncbi:MAG: hypothetical protein HFI76_12190 [Lachnospiraceae bacterium]|jgi:ribosomal protein L29|nr:hypothetical protein [Lachnospiraceae bacterium]